MYSQQNSCVAGSCVGETSDSCTLLLENSCDCRDSYFNYNCNCTYKENKCNVTVLSSQTPNSYIQSYWDDCQSQYTTPTNLLWTTFAFTIFFSIVIIILNIIQCVLKFDSEKLDFTIAIVSLGSSVILLALILIGNAFITDSSCIDPILTYAPGCILNAAGSQLTSQEISAQASLNTAYQNLSTSPILFFICAIPDLLSITCCCCGKARKKLSRQSEGNYNTIQSYDDYYNSTDYKFTKFKSENRKLVYCCTCFCFLIIFLMLNAFARWILY